MLYIWIDAKFFSLGTKISSTIWWSKVDQPSFTFALGAPCSLFFARMEAWIQAIVTMVVTRSLYFCGTFAHSIILTVPCHHFGMSSLPWSPETFQDVAGCCGLLCQQFPCHAAFRWRGHGRRGEHRGQGCDAGGGGVSGQRAGTATRWAGLCLGGGVWKKPGLPANSTN